MKKALLAASLLFLPLAFHGQAKSQTTTKYYAFCLTPHGGETGDKLHWLMHLDGQ